MSLDRDWQIPFAAMQKVDELRKRSEGHIQAAQLDDGFECEGERISRQASDKYFLIAAV